MIPKYLSTFFFIAFLFNDADGQTKTINIPKDDFWYKWDKNKSVRLNLVDLTTLNDSVYWRLWFNGQTVSYAIDFNKSSDNSSKAFVTLYTEEQVDSRKEKPTNRIYYYNIPLDDTITNRIEKLIDEMYINQIPSQEYIKGWGDIMTFDGVTYAIEYVDDKQYSFKSYCTPSAVKVKEAETMSSFIKKIEDLINFNKLKTNFIRRVPFQTFNTGGPSTITRADISDQGFDYKQERDDYRKKNHLNN